MKNSDTRKTLLLLVLAVGLHLMFSSLSPILLAQCALWGIPSPICAILKLPLKVLCFALPIAVVATVSGISLRRPEATVRGETSFLPDCPLALFFAGLGGMILLRGLLSVGMVLLKRSGITLPSGAATVPQDLPGIILFVCLSVLIPAVCEELFYRRMLLVLLLPFGRGTALLFTSFLFGIMHLYPQSMLYAAASGLLLGLCALTRASLKICIPLHCCNNLILFGYAILPRILGQEHAAVLLFILEGVFVIAGAVAAFYLARCYRRAVRARKEKATHEKN